MLRRRAICVAKSVVASCLLKAGFKLVRINGDYHDHLYRKHYSQEALEKKRFYNVGAGSFYHKYWTNIDYASNWYKDVQGQIVNYDLMRCEPLPIETATAEVIYTSHTIEHVTEGAVRNLFREVYRALRSGGYFRITTGPDADLDYAALMRGDEDWFYWDEAYSQVGCFEHIFHQPATSVPLEERWLHHVASQLAPNNRSPSSVKFNAAEIRTVLSEKNMEDALDYFTSFCVFNPEYPGNHISWWNFNKISRFLRETGFSRIYRSGYGQSFCPILRDTSLFDSTHPQMSVYVEAIR